MRNDPGGFTEFAGEGPYRSSTCQLAIEIKRGMRALIFDLDGVIVDTAEFHYLAWKMVGEEFGFSLTREQNERLKGISRRDSLIKILGWANTSVVPTHFEQIMFDKNEYDISLVDQITPRDALPGVQEFIHSARQVGYQTAIGSASRNAPFILLKLELTEAFDVILDGNSVKTTKPDPEVFTRAADQLGVGYDQCVVFEDSAAGIEAAKSVGMVTVGIGTSSHLSGADWIFPDFRNISIEFIN